MRLITGSALASPGRVDPPARATVRVGLVQHAWRADADALVEVLDGASAWRLVPERAWSSCRSSR